MNASWLSLSIGNDGRSAALPTIISAPSVRYVRKIAATYTTTCADARSRDSK
jgi:hypothetical protein